MAKIHDDVVKHLGSVDGLVSGLIINISDLTDAQKDKLNDILIAVEAAKQAIKPVIEGYYGDNGYLAY